MSNQLITKPGSQFTEGYLFATQNNPDDLPFATLTNFSIRDTLGLKELMTPEQLTACAVGASDAKIVLEADFAIIKLEQFLLARGGSVSSLSPITASMSGPTLAAASGTTPFTAGYIAVGFTYVNEYGQTLMSPLATQVVTSGQQINVSSLTPLPAGATSVNYFMSSQSYLTSAAALAAPVYLVGNGTGGATSLVVYPSTTAPGVPLISSLGLTRRDLLRGVNSKPSPTRLHFATPSDGSDIEVFAYGVIIPDISIDWKMKEFVVPKFTCNIYGDVTKPGSPIFHILMP